jgi:adenylate cyclase
VGSRFVLSIRTALSFGIIFAVVLTAAIVHIPWSVTSRSNIADLNTRLNALVIHSIAEKVDGLLENAVAVRRAISTNLTQAVIDVDDRTKREFLFLSFLQSQPSLTSIEFGWSDDHSFRARRAGDGTIRMEDTIASEPTPSRRTDVYRLGQDGAVAFDHTETSATDYRVSQQFWFFSAFDKDQPVWTNIYRLPESDVFGVTTTQAIERHGSLLGVLGVSISLDRLSEFLDSIEVSQNGSVFLTNISDELVAVQKQMAPASGKFDHSADIPKLDEVKMPAVRVLVGALKANDVNLQSFDRTRQFSFHEPPTGAAYFVTLAPLSQMGLIASVVIPQADILGAIDRNTNLLLIVLAGFLIVVALAATLIARRTIGRPLAQVTENLKQLEDFRFERILEIPSHFSEIRRVSAATMRMSSSLASFKKYIPTELVRTLFARGIEAELGGERRELTILFIDLAEFTRLSESLGDDLIAFLGTYLSEMSAVISDGQGTIDKYIGDAIMAFWGAPVPNEAHAVQACRAALECQARLNAIRAASVGKELPEIRARIGINTGRVLVGNIGSRDRLNYTVIGDPVNVASRLESLNKLYGTQIIIGENTYEEARGLIVARSLDRVAVYGKEAGIEMYELLSMREGADEHLVGWVTLYEQARTAMRARNWDEAIALFEAVIARRGGHDTVSSLQIARAQNFKCSPPPGDWDGLVVMETK